MVVRRPIRLPKQWPAHVKSGVLHAISLASVVLSFVRSRATGRRRLQAELEQANTEIALLREELYSWITPLHQDRESTQIGRELQGYAAAAHQDLAREEHPNQAGRRNTWRHLTTAFMTLIRLQPRAIMRCCLQPD